MIILGIGGKTYTHEHTRDTARVINEIIPNYLGALTLHLEDGIYDEFMTKFNQPFVPLEDTDILNELERLISNINVSTPIIFMANQESNVYSLGGTFPQDKEKLLSLVAELKNRPEMLKPKVLKRF